MMEYEIGTNGRKEQQQHKKKCRNDKKLIHFDTTLFTIRKTYSF